MNFNTTKTQATVNQLKAVQRKLDDAATWTEMFSDKQVFIWEQQKAALIAKLA